MKFCLINNLYKPYERGGAERIVEITAEGLAGANHDVTIISTRPYSERTEAPISRVKNIYIPSLYSKLAGMPFVMRLFWHTYDMFDLVNFFRVLSILRKGKFDAVITHNLKGVSFLVPSAVKLSGSKHIHALHDVQLIHPSGLINYGEENKTAKPLAKLYYHINRRLFGSPDAVVSPSEWLLNMHVERGFFQKSKRAVLNNPFPAGENVDVVLVKKDFFRFLYVGILEPHKGIRILLDAFKKLPIEISKQCELAIVGDGSLFDAISDASHKPANAKVLGRKSRQEIFRLMSASDCLVVPSLCYENSPTVIYEAMSAGLPVIGSDLGGIPELLGYNKNLLFKPEADLLKERLAWAVSNKSLLVVNFAVVREKIARETPYDYVLRIIGIIKK